MLLDAEGCKIQDAGCFLPNPRSHQLRQAGGKGEGGCAAGGVAIQFPEIP